MNKLLRSFLNRGKIIKVTGNTVLEFLTQLKLYFLRDAASKYKIEEPLRSELFSSQQLEQHSKTLANDHALSTGQHTDKLLSRLASNEKILLEVRSLLAESVKENNLITPAGEWLLDNFYLIEEQIRTAKKHLPKKYSEGLPQLLNGVSAGFPRVYDIAIEIISHSDGRIDLESLNNFMKAYHTVTPLQLGELWAIPIMLRLALIENLRRASARIAIDRINRNVAVYWTNQMIEVVEKDPKNLILVIADMARSNPPLERAFVAEFFRNLRGKGPSLAMALNWVEERLTEIGQTSSDLVQQENQKQAADQVSISNTIGSLRLLSSMDWRQFVESNSIVEQILRQDANYPQLDFNTRDHYRHVIEGIAKRSALSEHEVAGIAISLTNESAEKNGLKDRSAHVGFFLIDDGLHETEIKAKMKISIPEKIRRVFSKFPFTVYLGSIFIITFSLSTFILYKIYEQGINKKLLILFGIVLLFCISQLAVTLVNFISTLIAYPDILPRMDFSSGIPDESRALVVIPCIITGESEIDDLTEALEVRYLANKSQNLYFGLLTDFSDARKEELPEDKELLKYVEEKIRVLNKKHGNDQFELFFLFHRPRKWNAKENKWMGYERKRGKLAELNGLLRGNSKDSFSLICASREILPSIKYVITLDSDTQLPRDTAWKIVGTIAHPLNRGVYDENKKRVVKGYGILQPRVSVSLPDANSSLFARLQGNEPGLDPYTRAVSDVYQDLFHEGSFIGKGIYEIDIFEKSLNGNFPENQILSHDLLEGCYARSGLLSDVQLYEKYPVRYDMDIKRRHRWIRGDWQIAAWCLPFAPRQDHHWHKNPLNALSRWKIFDNIRRSLVPIFFTAFILLIWFMLHLAAVWTLIISAILVFPAIISSAWDFIKKPKDVIFSHHLRNLQRSTGSTAVKTFFTVICLPHEAYENIDAIARTLWRMLISHKNLLEWSPSDVSGKKKENTLLNNYLLMWFEPFTAMVVLAALIIFSPVTLGIAAPIIMLWMVAPSVTWWVSEPIKRQAAILTAADNIYLQKIARRTWSFFERFVTAEDNWLPPDNFQEKPVEIIAHRTSPTNIGLSILANLSAHDFGYITTNELIERTTSIFKTMSSMERHRGHFYNWYDTRSLQPLYPRYVSTVDSGNLVGHLLTFKQGILNLAEKKIAEKNRFDGLMNTFGVLSESIPKKDAVHLQKFKTTLKKIINAELETLNEVFVYLIELQNLFNELSASIKLNDEPANWWMAALGKQIQKNIDELNLFEPLFSKKTSGSNYIKEIPTLHEVCNLNKTIKCEIDELLVSEETQKENDNLTNHLVDLESPIKAAAERLHILADLAAQCDEFANIEYDFLYNKTKHLMSIGYNVEEHRTDAGFYDLLASEARLSTFVGISQGRLPQESWFSLSRLLTNTGIKPILLSWSGSMFEYLMPLLIMPSYDNTLLDQTDKAAVDLQINFGRQHGIPWGVSESCYNMVDASLNYQYHAFGVPGLGLKRGLGEDIVIAPYATFLALMIAPEKALENLRLLSGLGFVGDYGFYEAIDYTPSRLPRGENNVIVQCYMTHHQGMSLLAVSYLLHNKPMQARFEDEPQFKASLLLLQERIPKTTSFFAHTDNIADIVPVISEPAVRIINTPNTPIPEIQLLSNGKYHVMVTNSGGGYSRWRDLAITRWREDGVCDNWGSFCYIRDLDTGLFWSNTFQPSHINVKNYEAVFSQGRADFKNSFNKIYTHTEIVVSPEDDIEMRRVQITNRSNKRKTIDVTSYAEVVIATAASDDIHPAFSNLFVQTEILPDSNTILCTRRPRSAGDKLPWMFHMVKTHDKNVEEISYETDRMAFIGRGNTLENPHAMNTGKLSGSQGSVLDPIVSIRTKVVLEADETITLDIIYGIGETREICQSLIDKYQDKHHKDRVFELAWTHSQVVLRQINASESEAQLYSRLANSVIFMNPTLRAAPATLIKNNRGQPNLWPYSISGDLPIVLLKIEENTDIDLVRHVIQAHTFWRLKGLPVDLVIWNDSHGGYRQVLQNQVAALISAQTKDQPGGIFYRASEQISNEDRILFQSVARVIISSEGGTLTDHVNLKKSQKVIIPNAYPSLPNKNFTSSLKLPDDLISYNGYGGFSADGNEYVIATDNEKSTPAPWSNVIANPNFGTVISESGQSYTWIENAHEMRLTPWFDDPVCDLGGEVFFIKDEESGYFWSATPLPAGSPSAYITRHGFGYSVFTHEEMGIHSELWVYVDIESNIKFSVLKIKNNSPAFRKLSVTGYVEWVLGDLRPKTAMHVTTEIDPETGAILSRNPYNIELPGRVAFFDVEGGTNKMFTCDRYEFIGRNGTLGNPAAMSRSKLSGKMSVGLDPCTAIQVTVELAKGQEKEIIFKLGGDKSTEETLNIIRKFRGATAASESLERINNYWENTHEVLQVETPDTSLNLLANGWLTNQTLSSRMRGRSGYYQSGGAFGFRDQLQDVISLFHIEPELARKQILLCASRQFKEGDVQHWWHPPVGRGVRTRCSDDFLWLPFVCAQYIASTGDVDILKETISFLEGRLLNPDEESYYDLVHASEERSALYDHCVRAIKHGLQLGIHGLPLMGTGDWNDGMDRVGKDGKGESVWLAFFLYDVLMRFIPIANSQNDSEFSAYCESEANLLKENIEKNAWDGNWYKRAFFDDGTPLGSSTNEECKIDSISQSWSVLSGAGEPEHIVSALNSAYEKLVHKKGSLIQLLDPPFDKSSLDPGYIKGYVPGVRENGGQYTHAAVWLVMAFAKLGNSQKAWELFTMINPVNHGKSAKDIEVYKVEPYVAAADIYAVSPHTGRGGWTWYTGSAGWMYQLIMGSLLGIIKKENKLLFAPCIPADWETYKVHYRYKNTYYHITFIQENGQGEMSIKVDGEITKENSVSLNDDNKEHEIEIKIYRK